MVERFGRRNGSPAAASPLSAPVAMYDPTLDDGASAPAPALPAGVKVDPSGSADSQRLAAAVAAALEVPAERLALAVVRSQDIGEVRWDRWGPFDGKHALNWAHRYNACPSSCRAFFNRKYESFSKFVVRSIFVVSCFNIL